MSRWCPRCVAPVPERAVRCGVCGGDLRGASEDAAPGDIPRLAPRLTGETASGAHQHVAGSLARAVGITGAGLLGIVVLVALAWAAGDAGLGDIAWPALAGIGVAALLAGLLGMLRLRRRYALLARGEEQGETPDALELVHLFAGRFAPSVTVGETFLPPLAVHAVRAEEAAWRAIGATVLALAEGGIVELEPRSLPTLSKPVAALGVRLVRPAPTEDLFAVRLLRPLARRGVGASTILSDLVAQHGLMRRQPARTLLESARARLTAQGYYSVAGNAWLRAALFGASQPDAARIASARPALDELEARLAAWDADDPALVATIRHEARAGFIRARARAQ